MHSPLKLKLIHAGEMSVRILFVLVGIFALISGSFVGAGIALVGGLLSTTTARAKFLPQELGAPSFKALACSGAGILVVALIFGGVAAIQQSAIDQEQAAKTALKDASEKKAQSAALAARNRVEAQQKAVRDAAKTIKLSALDAKMDELFQHDRSSAGWSKDALAIAEELNALSYMEAPTLLQKWRANPSVIAEVESSVKRLHAIFLTQIPALSRAVQVPFAEKLDRMLLDVRIEAEVRTSGLGTKNATVTVRAARMGRVMADQMANQADFIKHATNAGFAKLTFTNSISGDSWTFDLDPPDMAKSSQGWTTERKRWAMVD
jgi:hypothetical protein